MRGYTIGGMYGSAIGGYLGSIINFVLCYCVALIPIKIYEKLFKKSVDIEIIFFVASIIYFFDTIFYVYVAYEPTKIILIQLIATKIGVFFIMLSIMLCRKISEYNKINNSNNEKVSPPEEK